jgi:hypothetical protein
MAGRRRFLKTDPAATHALKITDVPFRRTAAGRELMDRAIAAAACSS